MLELEEGYREEGAAARNLELVGWDLIEQVETAKSSIQTNVPLIRAVLQGGEGTASLSLPTGCWCLSAVCMLLIHRGSVTSAQMNRQRCS